MREIYIGCDTGEANDPRGRQIEIDLLDVVDAVSIACGGHAGDPESMRRLIDLASQNDQVIGAHPSYPDRDGFGRRAMEISRADLEETICQQLRSLVCIAESCRVPVSFVKTHGALYHSLAEDPALAVWFWKLTEETCPNAFIVMPVGCPAVRALREADAPVWAEGFCDRAYGVDWKLVSREEPGALIADPTTAADQAEYLVLEHKCDLLCVHSDTENSVSIARSVRDRLRRLEDRQE